MKVLPHIQVDTVTPGIDVIGDVHGCGDELVELLTILGYMEKDRLVPHSDGRVVVFVGDLVDRGPDSPLVLRIVNNIIVRDIGYCVMGNHDYRLMKYLQGAKVEQTHGLLETIDQLQQEGEPSEDYLPLLETLPSHIIFTGMQLIVAHAGIKPEFIGVDSKEGTTFMINGEESSALDGRGLPERLEWTKSYDSPYKVVYGHTPSPAVVQRGNTINIDTGCVFGGTLTAYRYPEEEYVQITAHAAYAESRRMQIAPDAEQR